MATKFIEKLTFTPIKKVNVSEKVIVEGKEIQAEKKYVFLVWDKNYNQNGRNYKYVIDRVIKDNRVTLTMCDHPEDAESMKDLCGIAKNPRWDNDLQWMIVDWYPIGEYGENVAKAYDLGAPISVSSCVLGNVDDENCVIDDDEFFLERYLDIVYEPSNAIYHSKDKIQQRSYGETGKCELVDIATITNNDDKTKNESKMTTSTSIKEGKTMEINENVMKVFESSVKLNVKAMLKDALNEKDPYKKLEGLTNAKTYASALTDKSLLEEVESEIAKTDDEIKAIVKKAVDEPVQNDEEKQKLFDENEELKEQLKKAQDEIALLKKVVEDDVALDEKCKALEDEKVALDGQLNEACNKISKLESDLEISEAEKNTMVTNDVVEALESQLDDVTDANALLAQQLDDVTDEVVELKESIKHLNAQLRESKIRYTKAVLESKKRVEEPVDEPEADDKQDNIKAIIASIKAKRMAKKVELPIEEEQPQDIDEDDKMDIMLGMDVADPVEPVANTDGDPQAQIDNPVIDDEDDKMDAMLEFHM